MRLPRVRLRRQVDQVGRSGRNGPTGPLEVPYRSEHGRSESLGELKVAFITPELDPLVRKSQVAEFASALPKALCEAGSDARVFMPCHGDVDLDRLEGMREGGTVRVRDVDGHTSFKILVWQTGAVKVYLFDSDRYFATKGPYGGDQGPYADNWRRYAAFSRAVLESFEQVDFAPDVLHCLDWTTGLVPLLQTLEYATKKPNHPAAKAGSFFQILNLASQGSFERGILGQLGIPLRTFQAVGGVDLAGKVSFLKAGCEYATVLGTNSPGHALRIQEQDRGYGLEEVFRRRSKELVGILQGIDYQAWDPSNDAAIAQPFSANDKEFNGKKKCKAALQSMMALEKAPRTPIAAMIGRFDIDSGFDLVAEGLTSIMERNVQVVLMGAGRPDIFERLRTMETTFVGRCRVINGYQMTLAHVILAGSDFLLLPSHYHPGNALCAIGMRYGVVPIVYAGSGLDDYVVDAVKNPRQGTGVHFQTFTADGLLEGVDAIRKLYKSPSGWKQVVGRCMRQDFSWRAAAEEYIKAYRRVTRRIRPKQATA